jgi:hypothetical protein
LRRPTQWFVRIAVLVAACGVAVPRIPLHAVEADPFLDWLADQRATQEKRLAALRVREAAAQEALETARDVVDKAEQAHAADAANTAQQAMTTANGTLAKLRAQRAVVEERLVRLQKAAEWRTALPLRIASPGEREVYTRAPMAPRREFAASVLIRGDVFKKTATGLVRMDIDELVTVGDEIRTGGNGYAELVFTDGTKLALAADTVFTLEELSPEKSVYKLILGHLHGVIDCLKTSGRCGERRYESGPNRWSFSLRGTEIDFEVAADGSGIVAVWSGIAEIQSAGKTIPVKPGRRVVVAADGSVGEPIPIDLRAVVKWWEGPGSL